MLLSDGCCSLDRSIQSSRTIVNLYNREGGKGKKAGYTEEKDTATVMRKKKSQTGGRLTDRPTDRHESCGVRDQKEKVVSFYIPR